MNIHCSTQMGIQMGLTIQMGLKRESSIEIWNGQNWLSPKIMDHPQPEQSKGDSMPTQTSFRRWNGCLPLLNLTKNLTFDVGLCYYKAHSPNNNNNTWQLSWFSTTALYSSHIRQQQKMGSRTEAKLKMTTAYYSKTRKGEKKTQTIQGTYIHPPPPPAQTVSVCFPQETDERRHWPSLHRFSSCCPAWLMQMMRARHRNRCCSADTWRRELASPHTRSNWQNTWANKWRWKATKMKLPF